MEITWILFAITVVAIFWTKDKKERPKTTVTIVKGCRGDTIYCTKTFDYLFPQTDDVEIFNKKIMVTSTYFNVETQTLFINAKDKTADWDISELNNLSTRDWETKTMATASEL